MIRIFDARAVDFGWYRSLSMERPGLSVSLAWRKSGQWGRNWGYRFPGGFGFNVGVLGLTVQFNMQRLRGPVVYCSKCKRMQPREWRSPIIGSPEWEKIPAEDRANFKGEWVTERYKDTDGVWKDKPYRWIGPCCVQNHSGYYGEGDDDYEEEWIGQCCICGGEVWQTESSCDCEDGPVFDW